MRTFTGLLLVLLTFLALSCQPGSQVQETRLHDSWKFRNVANEQWMPASVPGCVHTDLLENQVIGDPFYRLNEQNLQWIDKTDWEYRTNFRAPANLLKKENIEIVFKGLDTYADVYLNGNLILKADNMFREWKVNITSIIHAGDNELKVYFHSPIKFGLAKHDSLGYTIPVSDNDQSVLGGTGNKRVSIFTRKAGYHFGWDWGPRLVTSGIWKDIILRGWNDASIENLYVHQDSITEESALLTVSCDMVVTGEGQLSLQVTADGSQVLSKDLTLSPGSHRLSEKIIIKNPELWWPNGLGNQKMYNINVKVLRGSTILSEANTRIGLRTVKVVQEPDSAGKSFMFVVNGHPVFMKGANYIPQDVFLNKVTPDRYEHIVGSAAETHMNMLRVWGGGIYEKDLFYDLCDDKGILVWQDFMFACAMFPGDSAFLENVRQEAADNVRRLRNHPSIALWCGNNECLSAWYMWGWKDTVMARQGKEVADIIWKAYDDTYHHILPGVVAEYDPGRFYWSSSSCAGMGEPENRVACDVHYWGVWWGKAPFTTYRTLTARFMSEYGFQSFPELNSIKKFALEEDWDIYSEVMKSHQRSSIGNGTIEYYMLQDYKKPKDFPMFLYVGQLLQAEGTRVAMEGHRKTMPYCMGSLFWQIDDCWPVASWSTIDYYGNWKAQQYFARKAYSDILISPQIDKEQLSVYIVSDRLEDKEGVMDLSLLDFDGNIYWTKSENMVISANSSHIAFSSPERELISDLSMKNRLLLYCELTVDGSKYSENILYFIPVKDLVLPEPKITWTATPGENGYKLTISTDKLAKNIYCSLVDGDAVFSDNYFDLLPGRTVEIQASLKDKVSKEAFTEKLSLVSLTDSYQDGN